MTITAYRVTQRQHVATAFSGFGASVGGGRWNNKGAAVVYVAESMALAALELRVHVGSSGVLNAYTLIPCTFDAAMVTQFDTGTLPHGWTRASSVTRRIGTDWLAAGTTAVLRVPTAVVPLGFNYLINPNHADFKRVTLGIPVPFQFDRRLK